MREPAFWWRPGGAAAALWAPVGAVYGAVTGWRMERGGHAAGVPVVCVGNLTLGGTGKTPAAIAVATLLHEAGQRPFLLSRGYRGTLSGPVRVDPSVHRASEVGDEPLLLARAAPTIVSRDRIAGAKAARAGGATVIVMDDGFQNPSLAKDLSIVVVDGRRGTGNGRVFPAGPLRAPLATQLAHANAILVVGPPAGAADVLAAVPRLPVFHGVLEPDAGAFAALKPHQVLAFAGIADPERFFATLADAGIDVRERQAFPDHHPLTPEEAASLVERARRGGLVLVTTEKDLMRLAGQRDASALAAVARALPVKLKVEEVAAFRNLVLTAAGQVRSG
jgi:tetraacyldisaccharide 4'-kinase